MNWKELKTILCVRLDSEAGVIQSEPAIRALKETNPGARITLLAAPASAEAASLLPCVDEVLVYEAPWTRPTRIAVPNANGEIDPSEVSRDQKMIDEIRARKFDAAVIFTAYRHSALPAALFAHLAGIPRRLAHCRDNPCRLLTDWAKEVEPEQTIRHEVRRQLELVGNVACFTSDERIRLNIPERAQAHVEKVLLERAIDKAQPFVVVHPGKDMEDVERVATTIREIHRELGYPVLLLGRETESFFLKQIQESAQRQAPVPCHSFGGKLSLAEQIALLSRSAFLVTGDRETAQIAAAARAPVVDAHTIRRAGAAATQKIGPWQIPCRFAKDLEATEVMRAATDLLHELGVRPRNTTARQMVSDAMSSMVRKMQGLQKIRGERLLQPTPIASLSDSEPQIM